MLKRRSLIKLSLIFLASCSTVSQSPNFPSGETEQNSKTALKLAVTDIQGLDELKRDYEAFRVALETALDRKVEFYPVQSYTEGASALQLGKVDLVFIGPSEYVLIRARTSAIPVIAITRPNYHSVIAVSASSSIKTLADIKGKKIAMSQVGSTSGHLGPTEMLIKAGLDPKRDYQVEMLGRESSLSALKAGEVEVWGGPLIGYQRFLRQEGLSEADFPLLEKGPPLPNDVFVVKSNTNPQLIKLLRDRMITHQKDLITALSSVPANEKFQESTFVAVEDSDYNMIREVYQAIGEGNFLTQN